METLDVEVEDKVEVEAVTDVSPFMQHFQQWLQQGRASGAVADSYSHLAVHSCQSLSFVEFCLSGNGRPFALTIFCVWKFFLGFPSPFYCASFLLLCAFSLLCIFWLLCFSAFFGLLQCPCFEGICAESGKGITSES